MRLFDEHKKRKTLSLNGVWRYLPDPEDKGEEKGWQKGLPEGFAAAVPSVWNSEKGLFGYEGAVWYEKRFSFSAETLRICFDAVMTEADVWLDGEKLGYHYGGYTSFDFIKTDMEAEEHILVVRAENRFNEYSIPQSRVDWFNYGGIIRDVWVEALEGVSVLWNKIVYELSDDLKTAVCYGDMLLYNADKAEKSEEIRLEIGENSVLTKVTLSAGEKKQIKTNEIKLENVKLWSTDTPRLYTVLAETETDDLIDRIGFRKVEVLPDGIYLNGEKVCLKGVNRHEEYPDFGFAFPPSLMKRDLDIIIEMGCNSIRGSHYPNSKQFIDLCDENGILFWSEIPIWGGGFSVETLGTPEVVLRGLEMHREMVNDHYNHPSIIIWGMHNEINSSTEEARKMSETYYRFLKENGGNRVVTFASNRWERDICFSFCDVIAVNRYIGWYADDKTWEEFLDTMRNFKNASGFSRKPIIIGEFGAAAIYGNHTFDEVPWTEEYQAELIENCIKLFDGDPDVCGMFIWQFSDIRSRPFVTDRARGYNNKGLVNEHRKPKAAYFAARKGYKGE